jgi:RNA polymerase primary sigma factor
MVDRDKYNPEGVLNCIDGAYRGHLIYDFFEAYEDLTEIEREVLSSYFCFEGDTPKTLEQIGSEHGYTRERIRQIKEKALRKLEVGLGKKLEKRLED